ncbi:MAG TPA: hypothetical protein VHH88_06365 [Verrucomicrobiae bacterium]|nr:hypothetical protein [Verrucomicrobiae bacterium]
METISNSATAQSIVAAGLGMLGLLVLSLSLSLLFVWFVYFILTLPMRRRERARLFVHFLEAGLNRGASPEFAIQQASASHDLMFGVRFHLLAAWIEEGLSFTDALQKVPSLLPPQVVAILKTGLRVGDLRKVLPACRHLLAEGPSHVRGAVNYLVSILFLSLPGAAFLTLIIRLKIQPSFMGTVTMLGGGDVAPLYSRLILGQATLFIGVEMLAASGLFVAVLLYAAGPAFRGRLCHWLGGVEILSPWRAKRLKRDFSAMLALLLDAGVPEQDSVVLAGDSTATESMRRRAAAVAAQLKNGISLPDALESMDDSGELQWRVKNALRNGRGFLKALAGWHDALDAGAFALEQSAAQIIATGLVLLNGMIVALLASALFLALIAIIDEVALW